MAATTTSTEGTLVYVSFVREGDQLFGRTVRGIEDDGYRRRFTMTDGAVSDWIRNDHKVRVR